MSGYIRLHRKIHSNALLGKNPMARFVFLELLIEASWKDRVVDDRGRPLTLKRGQVRCSIREISEKTGLSQRNIRTIISAMTMHNIVEIDTRAGKQASIITICNYSKYQDDANTDDTHTDKQATNKRQTYKEGKEGKEGKLTAIAVKGRRAPMSKQMDLPTDMDPDLEAIRQKWNDYAKDAGKAQVRKLTKDRRDVIRQIMDENDYNLDDINEAIDMASRSDYLVEEGWFSFDWLFKAGSNISKVQEGRYGNGRGEHDDFMMGMSPKEYQQHLLQRG